MRNITSYSKKVCDLCDGLALYRVGKNVYCEKHKRLAIAHRSICAAWSAELKYLSRPSIFDEVRAVRSTTGLKYLAARAGLNRLAFLKTRVQRRRELEN